MALPRKIRSKDYRAVSTKYFRKIYTRAASFPKLINRRRGKSLAVCIYSVYV